MLCRWNLEWVCSAICLLQSTDQEFSIQYATGSVFGDLAFDTMSIGGVRVPNQALGVVYQAGKELLQSSCDGIIVSSPTIPLPSIHFCTAHGHSTKFPSEGAFDTAPSLPRNSFRLLHGKVLPRSPVIDKM